MKVTLVTDIWLYVDWQVMLFGNCACFWALASGLKIRLRIPMMLIALNIDHIKGFLSIMYLWESQSCESWRKEGIETLERSISNSLQMTWNSPTVKSGRRQWRKDRKNRLKRKDKLSVIIKENVYQMQISSSPWALWYKIFGLTVKLFE